MTQQNNEDRAVLQGRRKSAVTRGVESPGGGKAIPVNEQVRQLRLDFGTAGEDAAQAVPDGEAAGNITKAASRVQPKPKFIDQGSVPAATMEGVVARLYQAFHNVASNNGAPGPDRQSIEQVRKHLGVVVRRVTRALVAGNYQPGAIRRVWIPKGNGAQRGLGIPNVIDRMVAEAVRLVLEPVYEPTFHEQSHGFRPGRGCHTAIAAAKEHIEAGYTWAVDLDLEKFFDRVPHQRLMARLERRISDRRLLVLIARMLKAKVVLPDGVVVSTDEGVPQGGPLSPLLSNIVLDEFDAELHRRGHRFVRYADDCNVYVRSERAGERVMASLLRFLEGRMRLKVNRDKSAVARPEERHFLGFSLRRDPLEGDVEVVLSARSKSRIDAKIRELTPRNWGGSLRRCIARLNTYLRGWIGFFGICTEAVERTLRGLDAHIRRRLRAFQLKHWKRKRTIARKLIQLGVRSQTAWRRVYAGRKSLWALSHDPAVDRALRNAFFAERGLESLLLRWTRLHLRIAAPVQLQLEVG